MNDLRREGRRRVVESLKAEKGRRRRRRYVATDPIPTATERATCGNGAADGAAGVGGR